MSGAQQPDAPPQKLTKWQRRSRRYARSAFATLVAMLPVVSFALTIASTAAARWAERPLNVDNTQWIDVSPANGNCTCDSTHVSYCAETSDAFEGTAYLSIVVLGAELLMAALLCLELGLYGLFGGSHSYTRVLLILALLALSTQILSVISWYSTFSSDHCGDPSFESNGASIGWPFVVRCFEAVGMLAFVLYVTSLFPKTNRGPPSIPLVVVVGTVMVTSITTFVRGWMTLGDLSYSPWSACVCGEVCSSMAALLTLTFVCGILGAVSGLITIFFMSLRAVDNEAITLKISSVTSIVTAVFQLVVVITHNIAFSGGCGGSDLSDDGYLLYWPSRSANAAFGTQLAFLVLNLVYLMKAPCAIDPAVLAAAEVDATDGTPAIPPQELTVYYRYWWDHLKDPRTLAHEAREEDEDSEAGSDDDEEDDGADEAAVAAAAADSKKKTKAK